MERQLRLPQVQLAGQIADTALAAGQGLDHLEAQGIGQGLEQGPGLLRFDLGCLVDAHVPGNTL